MLKQSAVNLATKIFAKPHYVNITGKCYFDSKILKTCFRGLCAEKDNAITIRDSRIIGDIFVASGARILNSYILAKGASVSIGMNTTLNNAFISQFINKVKIGNYCSIGPGTRILESNHKFNTLSTYHFNENIFGKSVIDDLSSKGDVIIQDDVWIGSNVAILSGVQIGRGSVIGANSVVTKNIPPYSICGGNPASIIRQRFSDEIITVIEKSKWWERTPEKLKKMEKLFQMDLTGLSEERILELFAD